MKDRLKTSSNRQGFTLMEVIVTIMAAGILAAFFVQFMGTAMSRASVSMERVLAESGGEAVVETIIADYVASMNSNPTGTFTTITTSIDNNNYNNSSAGISVNYGYITFDSGGNMSTEAFPTDTLQITVQLAGGNDLVFLLGQSRTAAGQPPIRY